MNSGDADKVNTPALAERLRARIAREGAITFRDWMETALYDREAGYYQRHDLARWGRAGDYRTSAERSVLFAATFASYFAELYEQLGAPHAWTIIEAGAGAGHFARGILETLARDHPAVFIATRYIIDELSAAAGALAHGERLAPYSAQIEFRSLAEIAEPINVGIIFSNELLDALPVHRVRVRGGKLFELYVGIDNTGAFTWVEREPSLPQLVARLAGVSLAEGQFAEVNLEAERWLVSAAARLRRGYIITVDYGAEADDLYGAPERREGTLRGFSRHKLVADALARPGECDLTTTINWTQIREAGERAGLQTILFERQDSFLLRAGLLDRLERARARTQSEAEKVRLSLDAREMILPGGMGQSFQVLVQKKAPSGP